jgi:hypothetical protein
MMMGLSSLIGLGSLVCLIMVLIKQFQQGGAVHGIVGIVTCGLWTFIWGWMNASKLNIKNIMLIWTLLWVVNIAVMGLGGASMFMALRGGQ